MIKQRMAYSVEETCELLSVKKTNLYRMMKEGEIKAIKIGERTMFRHTDLEDFLSDEKRNFKPSQKMEKH